MTYGRWTVEFDDRLLAHLQIVIVQRFRNEERFAMSWIDGVEAGSGRSSVWLHPEGDLYFRFAGSRTPEIDEEWLRQLTESARSSRGLVVTTEDGRVARSGGVKRSWARIVVVLERRAFGNTGLQVSLVGLGAGQVGERDVSEADAAAVLNGALDLGVTLIDTARSYGASEERIGRHLGHRRGEFVLSTKGGSGVEGVPDWSPQAVTRSIEDSLRRTRSERIDVFHLHSCPVEVLRRGDLQDVLDAAVAAGEVGVAAYSGDNEHLAFAAESGRFGSVEASVSIADRWNLQNVIGQRPELGVIAKRPIANAPWRYPERPVGNYAELYWERLRALDYDFAGLDPAELAVRFTAFAPGVHSAIVGTAKLTNLQRNLAAVVQGPLPDDVLRRLDESWQRVGADWPSST